MVLMSNMPLGVGRKGKLIERPLGNLITAGWERSLVSKLKILRQIKLRKNSFEPP